MSKVSSFIVDLYSMVFSWGIKSDSVVGRQERAKGFIIISGMGFCLNIYSVGDYFFHFNLLKGIPHGRAGGVIIGLPFIIVGYIVMSWFVRRHPLLQSPEAALNNAVSLSKSRKIYLSVFGLGQLGFTLLLVAAKQSL